MPTTIPQSLAAGATLLALLLLGIPGAQADSWIAPQARLDSSADGRWYVILEPANGPGARFQLVQRKEGAARRRSLQGQHTGKPLRPLPGDRVYASGECHFPMEVFCLDGGDGFVLFETYANLGHRAVAVRYDRHGEPLWSLGLRDLFTAEEIGGFRNSIASIWWYESVGLDRKADDLVVVYEQPRKVPADAPIRGPNLGRKRAPGVVRISIADGSHHFGKPADLLKQVGQGTVKRQLQVLDAVSRARPEGWKQALKTVLGNQQAELAARVMAAVHLNEAGDARGKELVGQVASTPGPDEARAPALEHLPAFMGLEALPVIRAALREDLAPIVGLATWRALRGFGAQALDALVEMVGETEAPAGYRRTAIGLLGQLGAAAGPALPALHRAAQDPDASVAAEAREAARAIRSAMK